MITFIPGVAKAAPPVGACNHCATTDREALDDLIESSCMEFFSTEAKWTGLLDNKNGILGRRITFPQAARAEAADARPA